MSKQFRLAVLLGAAIALGNAGDGQAALVPAGAAETIQESAGSAPVVQKVHGVRGGRYVRGPHCYTAWTRNRGWHRHNRWCERNRWRDWRRDGRRGCVFGSQGFRCRF